MRTTWTLQNAKKRFSEVLEQAVCQWPQTITRRGKATAVLVSAEMFRVISGAQGNLVEFLRKSPLRGVKLDLH